MKGFMKGCGIAALILIVLGTILFCVAAATKSTEEVADIAFDTAHGFFKFDKSDIDEFRGWVKNWRWGSHAEKNEDEYIEDEYIEDDIAGLSMGDGYHFNIEDSSDYNDNYQVYAGDFELSLPSQGVKKLDLGIGGCVFNIQESDSRQFEITVVNSDKVQAYISDETLYITTTRTVNGWDDIEKCEIDLYIPRGINFEEIFLEMGVGQMDIERLKAGKIDMSVGAGLVYGQYLEADELDINAGAGEITINEIAVKDLDATVEAGNIELAGSVQSVDGECAVGNLELLLNGTQKDFDYQLECMAGSINIDGSDYTGLMQEKKVNNGTGRLIDLECSMGNILVNFQ